jgi:hypothetical protein
VKVKRVKRDQEEEAFSEEEVKGKPCYNCHNLGHLAIDCKMNACSHCVKFNCGHNTWTCPHKREDRSSSRGRDEGHTTSTSSGSKKTDSPKDRDDGKKASSVPNSKRAGKS